MKTLEPWLAVISVTVLIAVGIYGYRSESKVQVLTTYPEAVEKTNAIDGDDLLFMPGAYAQEKRR